MLCRRCNVIMKIGTSYEQMKDGRFSSKRYHECKKCHDKVYAKDANFQEYMNRAIEKSRSK